MLRSAESKRYANAGFTSAAPWRAPNADTARVNITAQRDDPQSLLSHYRRLLRIRAGHRALAEGGVEVLETDAESVLAFERTGGGERVIVLANCSGETLGALPRVGKSGDELTALNPREGQAALGETDSLGPWSTLVLVREDR